MSKVEGVYVGRNDPPQPPDHGFIARLTASATVPMPTLGYYAAPGRDGRPAPKVVGDDPILLEKTSHVRKVKEKMGQFFARSGLGASQIRSMTRDQIATFVYVVSQNESGYAVEPRPARA